jgi:hypothetical protein
MKDLCVGISEDGKECTRTTTTVWCYQHMPPPKDTSLEAILNKIKELSNRERNT